jgi:hypothetical protein
MPPVGFEPTIPVFKWAKIVHALDGAATVIGICQYNTNKSSEDGNTANSQHVFHIRYTPDKRGWPTDYPFNQQTTVTGRTKITGFVSNMTVTDSGEEFCAEMEIALFRSTVVR